MAITRAQSTQKGHASLVAKDQGKRPKGIQKQRRTSRLPKNLERDHPQVFAVGAIASPKGSAAGRRGTKRPSDAIGHDSDSPRKRPQKRPQRSSGLTLVEDSVDSPANNYSSACKPINPIYFWAQEGSWPKEYFESKMEHLLARKRSLSSLNRKRSNSATSTTPSDQKPREEKSAPYRDPRYTTLLETKASFMAKSNLDITRSSKTLCATLLEGENSVPEVSLFDDDIFESTCHKLEGRNEARIIQDIARLIVPSAESLATFGAAHLDILTESVNEGWNNSISLTGTRPQPDYSVGFRRDAFSEEQLTKLSPFIGDFIGGDRSFFMATYYMYFPFLTCEVKCGTAALDVADRQNAHSMTLAVRAVTELFRAVKREAEVHREILAFSVSHDHRSVRIYGHYPVVDGKDTKYYRHPIRTFDFTELDGKEKWTAYRFTKSVYDSWMQSHFARISSAIDQLPADLDFDNPSLPSTGLPSTGLPSTGLSQGLSSHHPSQSDMESTSDHLEQDSQSSKAKPGLTPSTSFTDSGKAKKRKGKK
ncbi:hypothetical protein CCM_01864 [Cordyceps militaris CM01]|uniref:DUF7924 domain-containing protein n=1 Tax=Cordyceps militaris (strain CM01) TaxID=983644 RepID=G3J7Z3_CORMM|nr:uncharacterized protein CCM_01864 [Cordyceps militaris CM01]EGX97204.1 hypothetical protein CCM_01864 [Cordyceps militaris CM01]